MIENIKSFSDLLLLLSIMLKPNVKTDKPIERLFGEFCNDLNLNNFYPPFAKIPKLKNTINRLKKEYSFDDYGILQLIIQKMWDIDFEKTLKLYKNFHYSFPVLNKAFYVAGILNEKMTEYLLNYSYFDEYDILWTLENYLIETGDYSVFKNKFLPVEKFLKILESRITDNIHFIKLPEYFDIIFIFINSAQFLKIKDFSPQLIFRICTFFLYFLKREQLKSLAEYLKKINNSFCYLFEAALEILNSDEKKATENFAKFLKNNKNNKKFLNRKEIKRNILLWYALLLLSKYNYKDEFTILWNHFLKEKRNNDISKVCFEILKDKEANTPLYIDKRIETIDGIHIIFYYYIFDKERHSSIFKINLVEIITDIIPFFNYELRLIIDKFKTPFLSLYKLINTTELMIDEGNLDTLKEFLKKEVESKHIELVWVYNPPNISPYQKKITKKGKITFKKLNYFSLIENRYNWISEDDTIFIKLLSYSYDNVPMEILDLLVDSNKFYFTKDENEFTKIVLKKSYPELIIEGKRILFPNFYSKYNWIITPINENFIFYTKFPKNFMKIADYVNLKKVENFNELQIKDDEDFKEIVNYLGEFFVLEVYELNNKSILPADKIMDYEELIYMYIGKISGKFVVNFILKPFEDLNCYIKFSGQEGVFLKHKNRNIFINFNTEKFNKLTEKVTKYTKESYEIFIENFDDLLNLIVDFKSLPFIKMVILKDLLFKDVYRIENKNITIRETQVGDYFEISGEIKLDKDKIIKFTELLEDSFNQKGEYVKLRTGEYLIIDEKIIEQLKKLYSISTKKKDKITIHKKLKLFLAEKDGGILKKHELADKLNEVQSKLYKIPEGFKGVLRKYQIEGFNWLSRMYELEFGVCLADDMGLGKTVQAIAFMENVKNDKPFLVIAPVSLIYNWEREIKNFSKNLNPIVFHFKRDIDLKKLNGNDVILISYNLLLNEIEKFLDFKFNVIIFDEAQMLKNPQTKRRDAATKLDSLHKIALTGTPIENNIMELWSLMDILNHGILGSLESFRKKFSEDENKLKMLRKIIKPFILRRTKQDVIIELPEKTEIIIDYKLSDDELSFYRALQLKAKEKFMQMKEDFDFNRMSILSEIVKLKLACCHPKLVNEKINLSKSSKQEVFTQLVEEILDTDHKALVFSQFVKFLNVLKNELDKAKIPYFYMDGSTPLKQRKEIISKFQEDNSIKFFLLSLKTGGVGLNLTAADIVIILDPWWNPAVELQASDRVHRIGQTKPVTIYKLIAKDTIEEKILKLQDKKKKLVDFLMENMDKIEKISIDDLIELLM